MTILYRYVVDGSTVNTFSMFHPSLKLILLEPPKDSCHTHTISPTIHLSLKFLGSSGLLLQAGRFGIDAQGMKPI